MEAQHWCRPTHRLRFSLDDFLPSRCREPSWRAVGPLRVGGQHTSPREQVTGALGSGEGGGNPT